MNVKHFHLVASLGRSILKVGDVWDERDEIENDKADLVLEYNSYGLKC